MYDNDEVETPFDPDERHTVLVYGTLRYGFGLNTYLREHTFLGERTLDGFHMYHLGGFPCIVPAPDDPDARIVGEVYTVDAMTLATLDRIEGYHGPNASNHYDRVTAQLDDGTEVQVYVYAAKSPHGHRIESGDFTLCEFAMRLANTSELPAEDIETLARARLGAHRIQRDRAFGVFPRTDREV